MLPATVDHINVPVGPTWSNPKLWKLLKSESLTSNKLQKELKRTYDFGPIFDVLFGAMGAACARRRSPPLVAEGETPFWEELDRPKPEVPAVETTEEKDEVELPGAKLVSTTISKKHNMYQRVLRSQCMALRRAYNYNSNKLMLKRFERTRKDQPVQ